MSQRKLIKDHLNKGFTITPREADALKFENCTRLAPVINRLRNAGMNIETIKVQTPKGWYAKYQKVLQSNLD